MSLLHRFPLLAHVLVLLSVLAACLSQDSILLLLSAGGAAAASRMLTEGPRQWRLNRVSSLILTVIIAVIILVQLAIAYSPDDAVYALTRFAIWVTVLKLYEHRTLEIEAERLVLSSLLMILAAMDAFDLVFGVLLLLWIVLFILVIMLFQLHYGTAHDLAASLKSDEEIKPISATVGQQVRRHIRRALMWLTCTVLMLSALLFIFLPRSVSEQLSSAAAARISRTGGGQKSGLTLVSETRIVESPTEVAAVDVTILPEANRLPSRMYFRTGTASHYVGNGRWKPMEPQQTEGMLAQRAETVPLDFGEGVASWLAKINIQQKLQYVPLPDGALTQQADRPLAGVIYPWKSVVQSELPEQTILHIRATGRSERAVGPMWSALNQLRAAREVAEDVLESRGLPLRLPESPSQHAPWRMAVSEALVAFLQSGRFRYTLDLSRIGRDADVRHLDPLIRFLKEEPVGHCEYFAAAFVAMAQSLDLQARIVTGFMVMPESHGALQYIIRDRDAHAWAEVRVDQDRWVRFDPTVSRRMDQAMQQGGVFAAIQKMYEEAEAWWRLHILGYDLARQNDVEAFLLTKPMAMAENGIREVGAGLRWLDRAFGFRRFGSMYVVGMGLFILLTAWLVIRRWRQRRRFFADLGIDAAESPQHAAIVAGSYGELLRLLRSAGHEKPSSSTPLAWCERLGERHPDAAKLAVRVVRAFYAVRYGGQHQVTSDRQAIRADLMQLKAVLKVR